MFVCFRVNGYQKGKYSAKFFETKNVGMKTSLVIWYESKLSYFVSFSWSEEHEGPLLLLDL